MFGRRLAALSFAAMGVLGVITTGAALSEAVAAVTAPPASADGCSGGGFWPYGGGQRCVYTQPDGTVIWCDSGGGMGIWVSNNCYPAPPPP